MSKKWSIGIDIGGTNTDIGLVSEDGKCVSRKNLPTAEYSDEEKYTDDLADCVRHLLQENSVEISQLNGVGIGAPNGNFFTGCMEKAPNLRFAGDVHLKKLMENKLGVKTVVTNDANAAAYGEKVYGGAKAMNDFILVTLGTGVGSGIVCNGQLLYGHDGFAGELGHAILHQGGRQCSCGRCGCLETYASSRGIVQTYNELAEELGKEPLPDKNCKIVKEKADKGDPIAMATWERTAHHLGLALANAVAFSSPEAIFLMGGPTQAGHWLYDPLRIYFEENLLSGFKGKIRILPSALPANEAAILGAAALVNESE